MEGDTQQDTTGQRRLSVQDAAAEMGTTVDAIRKRVQRRTIPHEKDAEGRVWVLLDADRPEQATDRPPPGQRLDALLDAKDETIGELRAHVAFLEGQLERRGEELRGRAEEAAQLHRIVAGLTQANTNLAARMPALEAPRDAEGPGPTQHPTPAPEGPHAATEAPEQRSWWRRVFGR